MYKFIISLFQGKEKKTLALFTILSFISPFMELFSFSMILVIMNKVISQGMVTDKILFFTFAMAGFCVFKALFEFYKNNISNKLVYYGSISVSARLYDLVMNEDLLHHISKTPMQALAIVKEDTSACIGILTKMIGVITGIAITAGYLVAFVWYAGPIGLLVFAFLFALMTIIYYRNRRFMRLYGDERRRLSILTNAQVTTAYGAFKEMKIDNRSEYLLNKYGSSSRELASIQSKYSTRDKIISILMKEFIMMFLFLFLGFFMLYKGNIVEFMASMIIYVGVLIKMVPGMYGIVSKLNGIDYAKKSYEVLKDCMERYTEIKEKKAIEETYRAKKLSFKEGLFVEGLSFGYVPEKKIFDNASIDIPSGSSVAIIGPSGAGKTTFLDLVLGLLDAESGTIRYDDYELITKSDSEGRCNASLGDIVSYIPQVVYLNGETIKHNVAFFEEDNSIDEKRIEECLRIAQIWDDVSKMKDGIDSVVGENGTTISGGQRQRIALARALYKEFELLVMDEATAALDMETEKAVIDSIRNVKGDKTLLMVTHHMSLANECDIVYKIENQGFTRVR